MDTNAWDVNQLESDALLPPRKRLLAGLKKQNSNGNGSPSPPLAGGCASSSSTSHGSSGSTDVQTHLDSLLASHLNDPNLTPKEVADSSRSAAAAAAKAAKAARAAANQKTLIAAKAVAAAKSALALFHLFPEEVKFGLKDKSPKKNKQKKHVPVELLYSNTKDSGGMDEALTHRLHRAINSSPRGSRNGPSFEGKGGKNKKIRTMGSSEDPRFEVGGSTASGSMFGEHDIAGIVDSDSSDDGVVRNKTSEKDKTGDESSSLGKRRGIVKLKKLPLSICSSKDQENNHKEDETRNDDNRNNGKSLAQPECSSDGVVMVVVSGPSWKCQGLKAPECAKQNKAVRS